MLKQASVSDLIMDRVSREKAYIVITMRRYPRFVNRLLRDEYINTMSPDPVLFQDWLSAKRACGHHNPAFPKSRFEERFRINEEGFQQLERLSRFSRDRDVYLICSCKTGERCHREMVLMLAKAFFKAKVEAPRNEYPVFSERLRGPRAAVKKRLILSDEEKKKAKRVKKAI